MVLLRERTRPGLGIIKPCLPSPAKVPPSGPGWLHEIKHDGFRIMARRSGAGVQLITRAGNDFSRRFPFIAMAVKSLPVRSCLIDGETIVYDTNGLAVFELIRRNGTIASAVHCAFDLLELDGQDLGPFAYGTPRAPAPAQAGRRASRSRPRQIRRPAPKPRR
jgi:bifunctional non-homologous end joining protein LigD